MPRFTRRFWLASACGTVSGLAGCGKQPAGETADVRSEARAADSGENHPGTTPEAAKPAAPEKHAHKYVLEPLPSDFQGPGFAAAMNRDGQVVGQFTTRRKHNHACRWDRRRLLDLDRAESLWSAAMGINRRGHVVGEFSTGPGLPIHGFLWSDGAFRDLGTLDGRESHALAINDEGLIAGWIADPARGSRATVWEHGKARPLGGVGTPQVRSQALALNRSGAVVGSAHGNRGARAMIWNDRKIERLEPLKETRESIAAAINDAGDVAGTVRFEGDRHPHACLWRRGEPLRLRELGFASTATAVGDGGLVGGTYYRDKGEARAFLWTGHVMIDLTEQVQGTAGLVLRSVRMIDERGWVAGAGDRKGIPVAFLARPR